MAQPASLEGGRWLSQGPRLTQSVHDQTNSGDAPDSFDGLGQCGSILEPPTRTSHLETTPRSRCDPTTVHLCDRASVMATLASSPPTSPSWPKRRTRAWVLRCERYCCAAASCFPLAFVYGLTTWAVYVEASIGFKNSRSPWIGTYRISHLVACRA